MAGATGLVGRAILERLLADASVAAVHALGRRAPGVSHPKLTPHVVDLSALPPLPPVDELYLALGTTIKAAGSQAAFRAVDFDANLSVARAALAVRAVALRHERLSVLNVDAHPDLYDDFQGNRLSHASPFARIMKEGLVSRLVQVGIRTLNGHQREQAARFGVEVHEMKDWRDGLECDFDTPVYISFDVDGLDPAYAPGVSHREPGGLSTRQVIDLIHRVGRPAVGADVVEFNPRMDVGGVTAAVCAKVAKELAGVMLRRA